VLGGWGRRARSKNSFDEEKREGRVYVCGDFKGGGAVECIHPLLVSLHLSLNICILPYVTH
jgi:hypothetical protein